MLGKPKQIFISYGAIEHPKTKFVVRAIGHEIQYLSRRGYRIQQRLIADGYWLEEGGEISSAIRGEIDAADGAIIILTPVDVGAALSASISLEDLRARARQNVIHEYGFLQATLPHSHIKVFSDRSVEIPTNLVNFARAELMLDFVDNTCSPAPEPSPNGAEPLAAYRKIRRHVRGLVLGPLRTRQIRTPPLRDSHWPIDLLDFVQAKASLREVDLVSEWGALLRALEDPSERLLACYERIAFDTYLAPRDVWHSALTDTAAEMRGDAIGVALLSAISLIRQYQIAAAESSMSRELAELICSGLEIEFAKIDGTKDVAPITKVVILDYLALSHMRLAAFAEQRTSRWWQWGAKQARTQEAIASYKCAATYLSRAAELAAPFERILGHPVWQAFTLYNLARTQRAIALLTNSGDCDWVHTLDAAIGKREMLCDIKIELPESVRMGFLAEYIHACLFKWETATNGGRASDLVSSRQKYFALKASQVAMFPLRKSVEERYEKALQQS